MIWNRTIYTIDTFAFTFTLEAEFQRPKPWLGFKHNPAKMAARYTILRNTARTLFQHHQSPLQHSLSAFPLIRTLHSLVAPHSSTTQFRSPYSGTFRGMVSAPNRNIHEAPSLTLDNRVPATVITGFLGSGKVSLSPHFIFLCRTKITVCKEKTIKLTKIDSEDFI